MKAVIFCSISVIALLLALTLRRPPIEEPPASLDGIYTHPRVSLDRDGNPRKTMPWDWELLELHQGKFRYWHFSCVRGRKYPIEGTFTLKDQLLILPVPSYRSDTKRYIYTTIKGVSGLWSEEGLRQWKSGTQVNSPDILVRVSDSPVQGKTPNIGEYVFPDITPLFDKEAVKESWRKEQERHEARYNDLEEPLRSLLREFSRRDDGNRLHYKKATQRLQRNMDPLVINQLVENLGDGPYQSVASIVLGDLFGSGIATQNDPLFLDNPAQHKRALTTLVDAIPSAKNGNAITDLLKAFLKVSKTPEIDLDIGNGTQVKIWLTGNGYSYSSFRFTPEAPHKCHLWAKSRLEELYKEAE